MIADVGFEMANDGLYRRPASAAFALFVLLVAVVALQGWCGQDDLRFAHGLRAAIASITDAGFDSLAATALAMCQNLRQGFAVVQVLRMADHADDDVGLGRRGYRDFVAIFVGLVILAFTDATNLWLVQRINFVVIFGLLIQHPFVEQKLFLVTLEQGVARQGSSQFPNQGMGNGTQAFQGFLGFGTATDMPKVTQFQAQVFNFLLIGAALLNTVGFGQLVQAIDDFNRQFAVGRIGNMLFLDGGAMLTVSSCAASPCSLTLI